MTMPAPATILAIDDSLTIRKLIDLILKGAGYEVLLAEKGETGLALARQKKPDLILLDYVLPDMPSPEICRQLLADPATASLPVLMISTNGAAIRQLYADSRNVRDYLTKPFQAKVLLSVIAHLLTKPAKEEAGLGEVPGAAVSAAPFAAYAEDAPPPPTAAPDHHSTPRPAVHADRTAPVPPSARAGAGHAAAASDDAHAILRSLLNTRFRSIARMIPELESRRGKLPAETFYLPYLLRNELVADIAAEMGRAQLASEGGEALIAGTADWMGIDATLIHLGRTAATGVFALRLPAENIDVILSGGEVIAIHSDNPKAYCAGAPLNFRALPPAAIAHAVTAQQRSKVPFFISLSRGHVLRDPSAVLNLLRLQGARALHRALVTTGARYAFVPRGHTPNPGSFSLGISPHQALLEALRHVDDWLEIESATGSVDTVFRLTPAGGTLLGELQLSTEERRITDMTDGVRPLQEVSAAAGLGLYETCAAVYRLLKLQVLAVETAVAPIADTSVEDFLSETTPNDEWGALAPAPTRTLSPNPPTNLPPNLPSPWPKF